MLYIIASADDSCARGFFTSLCELGARGTLLDMSGVGSTFDPQPEETVAALFLSEGTYKSRYLRIMKDGDTERLSLTIPVWARNLATHYVALNPSAPSNQWRGRDMATRELYRVLNGDAKLPKSKRRPLESGEPLMAIRRPRYSII